jgi:hypothetical protein
MHPWFDDHWLWGVEHSLQRLIQSQLASNTGRRLEAHDQTLRGVSTRSAKHLVGFTHDRGTADTPVIVRAGSRLMTELRRGKKVCDKYLREIVDCLRHP